ncbi:MAG: hypothetical protein IPJ82_05675 [Lewinellaceae bacterium]|nr:hypothetical protein [Lewinellaceae bacterium]
MDADCTEALGADQILEGGPYGCYDDYIVQLDKTPPYGNGPWVPAILGPGDIGKTYAVQVTDRLPATNAGVTSRSKTNWLRCCLHEHCGSLQR